MKWDRVVSIVTRRWVQQSRVHSWQGQVIFLFPKMTRLISGTCLVSFSAGTRISFPAWGGGGCGESGQSVWIYIVLKLRMSGAVPLHPVCFWHRPFSSTNFMEYNREQLAVAEPVWTFPIFSWLWDLKVHFISVHKDLLLDHILCSVHILAPFLFKLYRACSLIWIQGEQI